MFHQAQNMFKKWRHRLLPASLFFVLLLTLVFTAPTPSYSQRSRKGQPATVADTGSVEWDKFLIKGEPTPTLRIPAAHQHAATGCYGYLYVTRDEIWYEVISPPKDRDHAFRLPRATLSDARQWRFMGSTMPEVELKFTNGKVFHFFRVRQDYLNQPNLGSAKFRWEDVLSWEPLAQAATDFDGIVRVAEERQAALAPRPLPTVSMNIDPGTVEKGHAVTLTWTSNNATSLDLEPGIGSVPGTGSRSIVPEESTTYVLTAQGPGGGNNASGHVTVNAPQMPPAIVLVDPPVSTSGQTVEFSKSPLIIRGVVMDSAGLPVVTINGVSAALRPKNSQAAEFTSDPMILQPGENRFEITATSPAHIEAKVVLVAHFTPPAAPALPPPTNAKGLAKIDILHLLNGEVPSARVASLVKERGIKFAPTDDDINEFRSAGGGDDLIDALKQSATPGH
jgi:hypothetical protein